MGLWDRIKDVGGRAGRWVGDEVGRLGAPIVSASRGDWSGALSGIGRGVQRAGQVGALLGKDKLAGVDVDLLGAAGGAVEGGLGPSDIGREYLGDTGSGGFAGAFSGAATGYGGVQVGKGLHNIGERLGINKQLGKIPNPFTDGPNYGPTRDEANQQLTIRPEYEGFTPEGMADAEYQRAGQLQLRSRMYGGTPEMLQEGRTVFDTAADADPRTIYTRTAGTPLVPEGKIRHRFAATGGPGGERYPEQQAAIEQAQWRATVPDVPDPIRTPGFYSPDTPESERTPIAFAAPQIPEDVIDPRSYMTAPAAVGPPVSAQANMNALGAVPAARFGAPAAIGTILRSRRLATPTVASLPGRLMSSVTPVTQADGGVTPTETPTDTDPRSIWRRGLDYAGEHPDVIVNAAGQLMAGGAANDYYRQQAAVAERRMTLQEQQQAYAQDKERLREAMMVRGPTSRWA